MKSHKREDKASIVAPSNNPSLKNTNVNMNKAADVGIDVVRGTKDFLLVKVGINTMITRTLAIPMI
jgi:hypothetical protein